MNDGAMTASGAPAGTAPAQAASALSLDGLGHRFGTRQVLRDVSFTVAPGDFTVLLGLNGAGKTTLFSLATGLYAAHQGAIRIFGNDLRRDPSVCLSAIGVVFQQPTLDLDLTVEQNLFYHAALHGLSRREAAARIADEITRVGLAGERHDKARRLSGGQRRRIEIARALLHRPRLLLLDEPTVGLDIASRQFLIDHVRSLCRDERLAALWATHLIDEVGEGARVVVLDKGEVLAAGDAAQVLGPVAGVARRNAFEALVRQHDRAA
jgi:ABC-2 type transport system ATP-binding protein